MMIQTPNKQPPKTPNITGNTDELLVSGGEVLKIVITLEFAFAVILSSARMVVEWVEALNAMVTTDSMVLAVVIPVVG